MKGAKIAKLEHCDIRSFDLEATMVFYRDVVGLTGPVRDAPHSWLYDESGAAVIISSRSTATIPRARRPTVYKRLGPLASLLDPTGWHGGGAIDHIAFQCSDFEAMAAKPGGIDLMFRTNHIESMNIRQIFVNDPSGVTLELNFRG